MVLSDRSFGPFIAAPLLTINQASAQSEIETVTVGDALLGIAFNPDNGFLYVANLFDDTVTVIDGSTNTVVGREFQWFR